MSYGLQVFDSSGDITLDTGDRLLRYFGKVTGSIYAPTLTLLTWYINIPNLSTDGTWFVYPADIWHTLDAWNTRSWLMPTDSYTIQAGQIAIVSYGWTGRQIDAAFEVYRK
jgi:hypothetical protein